MSGVLIFVIAILVVVMIHESGHFFVAKAFGFKATQFFVGFGPTLWSVKKGETEYGVKALPLGGFVKIVGMNPYEEIAPEDEHRSYANKPRWQRALVIVAGSATHFVVAFVILVIAAMTIGFPTGDVSNKVSVVETTVEGAPSAASAAGLQPGDEIIGVGSLETTDWEEIRTFIRDHAGEPTTFSVLRDGETLELDAELGSALFGPDDQLVDYAPFGDELRDPRAGEELVGFLGVQPDIEFQKEGLVTATGDSIGRTWDVTKLSFRGIGETATMVFGGELWDALSGQGERELDEGPLGIVGAGRFASESVDSGRLLDLVGLIVGFTVFVGLMNLLPLPPLDGGYLAVLAYESITRKTVDVRKLIPVAAAVISFFVILFVAVLYLDLARPIRVPF